MIPNPYHSTTRQRVYRVRHADCPAARQFRYLVGHEVRVQPSIWSPRLDHVTLEFETGEQYTFHRYELEEFPHG